LQYFARPWVLFTQGLKYIFFTWDDACCVFRATVKGHNRVQVVVFDEEPTFDRIFSSVFSQQIPNKSLSLCDCFSTYSPKMTTFPLFFSPIHKKENLLRQQSQKKIFVKPEQTLINSSLDEPVLGGWQYTFHEFHGIEFAKGRIIGLPRRGHLIYPHQSWRSPDKDEVIHASVTVHMICSVHFHQHIHST
jgi:hypothetical protein